jgi:monoamine oxidase
MSSVVVVGAGLAGLAAARRLVARGHEVTVVEARERVGGRTEGLVLDDGTPLELGGQWLGEGHTRMHELVGELGLSTFRTWNDEGRLLLELQGKRSTMKPHKGAAPRISPFAVADLAQGLLRFARLAARTDLERPWLTPGAEVLDGQTWETWIRRNLRTSAGRAYFHIACEAVWAAEARDVSLLHALFYTHSNADLETLVSVDRGAQQDRVVGGSVRVAEAMAAALGERVVLGRPVRRIEHDDSGVRVIARDGSQYHGGRGGLAFRPKLRPVRQAVPGLTW